jgi:rod shape-determining protein MreB
MRKLTFIRFLNGAFSRIRPSLFITKFIKRDLAIDLGTSNTRIAVKGQGIVVNEPSVLAVRSSSKEGQTLMALGQEAKSMLGREPKNITAVRPVKDGVIGDFTLTAQMLKAFVDKALNPGWFRPTPRIAICVPGNSSQVERRAIREAAMAVGAEEVHLIEEPIAAALGAGLQVTEAKGFMVINMGGGITELAVISLGGVVYQASIRVGGDYFEECLIGHIRQQHGLQIGQRTAERIKIECSNVLQHAEVDTVEVSGQKFPEGVPRTLNLTSAEIREALSEPLSQITSMLKLALEQTPAELAADIAQSGIVLTGGGALLKNLDRLLMESTGLPVRLARGCAIALEHKIQMRQLFVEEE